jgi:hypothetical protein
MCSGCRRATHSQPFNGQDPPYRGAVDENTDVLRPACMPVRMHPDRRARNVDHGSGFAFVRSSAGNRDAIASARRYRANKRSSETSPAALRLKRALRALVAAHRLAPGIDCCAMRAKSPMTRCIEENAGPPDAMTPCIALTRFCACFMSGIIAITAFASLAPGTPAI